jgi:asparagine synthase (glutamine-hydrolysing)
MCGIAGIALAQGASAENAIASVRSMTQSMFRRGPDAEGQWTGPGVVLGHRRLAIIDLDERANQPMTSKDGRFTIVFNGEIYNYKALRNGLAAVGVSFRTSSDTEVLLALFAIEGHAMLYKLRGMFALAIWDNATHELFLARDPYGIKPLYYAEFSDGFAFASQVRALAASKVIGRSIEPAGLAGFYLWGSVPEPWTMYKGIFSIPSGHWLRVRHGKLGQPVCWLDISELWRDEPQSTSIATVRDLVRHAVGEAVSAHMVADVPVSVFLSGGIDSSAIAGHVSAQGGKVEGITIGFDDFAGTKDDEIPTSQRIAKHFDIDHYVKKVTKDEFLSDVPRILEAMDQPTVDGINTWFASKAAAERGYKVALSGVGGDELFYGYSLFRELPRLARLGRIAAHLPFAKTLLALPFQLLAQYRHQPKAAFVPEYMGSIEGWYFLRRCLFMPSELDVLMGKDVAREGLERLGNVTPRFANIELATTGASIGLLESTHYLRNQLLRDSDWASMAHSVELRTPLVDYTLAQALSPHFSAFEKDMGKLLLAESPPPPIPKDIISRPKTGFSIPMARWIDEVLEPDKSVAQINLTGANASWARRWAYHVAAGGNWCG